MKRKIKWENDGLKVEFTFGENEGKVNMEAKVLRMSKSKSRYVPFRLYAGKHYTSCDLPFTDPMEVKKCCSDTIEFVKKSYKEQVSSSHRVSSLVDVLLDSHEMPFAEVGVQAPAQKNGDTV